MNQELPLPGDLNMERCVISCMMQAPEFAVDAAIRLLTPSDFQGHAEGLIYATILRRHQAGDLVDAVSLMSHFYDTKAIPAQFPPVFISECATASPNPAHVAHYATAVLEFSKRRQMARIATELARAAVAGDSGEGDWRSDALGALRKADAVLLDGKGEEILPLKAVATQYLDYMDTATEEGIDPPIPTGVGGLDKMLVGGVRREYIIIGGRQGHGKTLLAMQMAGTMASRGRRGLIVGYEMSAIQIFMRDLARESGVTLNQVMGREKWEHPARVQQVTRTIGGMLQNWDVSFIENPYISLENVAALARSLHRRKPLDFVVVDFLQQIPYKRQKERSDEALTALSYQLARLQKELGCCMISPVQLNDDGLIREARGILDAPQVFLRIEMEVIENDGQMESGDTGMIRVIKNRFGAPNRACPVFRNGPLQKFEDREHQPRQSNFGQQRRQRSNYAA